MMNKKFWITFLTLFAISFVGMAATYKDSEYHFRIKGLSENTSIKHDGENYLLFSEGDETVVLFRYRADDDSRMKYSYFQILDSLALHLSPKYMVESKDPWFSSRIERTYKIDDASYKTIAIYGRQYVYVFAEQYKSNPELLARVVDGFKTSRTGCIQNLTAMLEDRLSGDSGFWNFVWMFVFYMIRIAWCTCLAYGLFFYVIGPSFEKGLLRACIVTIISLLVFFYLTLHDYLLDWFMGFGSFLNLFFNFFSMFSGD